MAGLPPVPDLPGELFPVQPTNSDTIAMNNEDFMRFFILFPTRKICHRHHCQMAMYLVGA